MVASYLLSTLGAMFPEAGRDQFLERFRGPWIVWEPGKWSPAPASAAVGETMVVIQRPQLRRAAPTAALAMHLQLRRGESELTLGREPTCSIAINDRTLSRVHLKFTTAMGAWFVADAGSRNGSLLDGHSLSMSPPAPLRDGAEIDASEVLLTFAEGASLFRRVHRPA